MVSEPAATRMLTGGKAMLLADLRTPAGVATALGGLTVSAAVFARRERTVSDQDLAAVARALLAAEERIRTASPQTLAERLPGRSTGPLDEFEARVAATRGTYLPEGRVTPEQLRRTIDLILAHQPRPASLKLPRPEDMLYLEPLRRALGGSR
jgi:hypothetical protein